MIGMPADQVQLRKTARQAEALAKDGRASLYRAVHSCLEGPCGRPPACISQHYARRFESGVPCESWTRLCGFADRSLGCSANGTFKRSMKNAKCRMLGGSYRLRPTVCLASRALNLFAREGVAFLEFDVQASGSRRSHRTQAAQAYMKHPALLRFEDWPR